MIKNRNKLIIVSILLLLSFIIASAGTFAASKPVLRKGMNSSAVKTLQTNLKKLGFFTVTPTGYFGEITLTAVKKFQKKYKIPTTGVVATLTHAKLDELLRPAPPKKPKPKGLAKGSKGSGVKKLQKDLIALGYMKVSPTGNFASITEAALTQFQKYYGIEPHGVADTKTVSMIGRLLEQIDASSRGGDDQGRTEPAEITPKYEIVKEWVRAAPQEPFLKGVGKYDGVVIHYTDNPGDSARIEANYVKHNWENAFVHEFIDADQIIQVADPDYKAWGAGKYANDRFIHLELCHEYTRNNFNISFKKITRRAAEYLYRNGLGVTSAKPDGSGSLWGHIHVSKYLGGTNHVDPIAYLAKWGVTWDDVVETVTAEYNALVEENTPVNDDRSDTDDTNKADDTAYIDENSDSDLLPDPQ